MRYRLYDNTHIYDKFNKIYRQYYTDKILYSHSNLRDFYLKNNYITSCVQRNIFDIYTISIQ